MINVAYLPSSQNTPLPDPSKHEYDFKTFGEFKQWTQDYVCVHCLVAFYESHLKDPKTLKDWLSKGCGFEISVFDPDGMVDWDAEMLLPENYKEELEEHMQILADAFERHG